MKQIIVYLIITVLLFTSCKKEKTETTSTSLPSSPALGQTYTCSPNPIPITNGTMLDCKFKPGTYWVFQDSVTSNIDTLIVESLTNGTASFPPLNYNGPCPVEAFYVKTSFKHEPDIPIRSFKFEIHQYAMYLESDLFCRPCEQPTPYVFTTWNVGPNYKAMDSAFIYDRYYKNIGISPDVEILTVENPNIVYYQTIKSYFNVEYGFLQFELRNRVTDQLISRRKVIARNIVK